MTRFRVRRADASIDSTRSVRGFSVPPRCVFGFGPYLLLFGEPPGAARQAGGQTWTGRKPRGRSRLAVQRVSGQGWGVRAVRPRPPLGNRGFCDAIFPSRDATGKWLFGAGLAGTAAVPGGAGRRPGKVRGRLAAAGYRAASQVRTRPLLGLCPRSGARLPRDELWARRPEPAVQHQGSLSWKCRDEGVSPSPRAATGPAGHSPAAVRAQILLPDCLGPNAALPCTWAESLNLRASVSSSGIKDEVVKPRIK